jgi:hypothetical protein
MPRFLALIAALSVVTFAAHAQQNRQRLQLPVNVPFGASYAQAKKILGSRAQPAGELTLLFFGSDVKALEIEGGYPRADGRAEDFNLFFSPKGRLVLAEVLVLAEDQQTFDACVKADNALLPTLLKPYGQPDDRRTETSGSSGKLMLSYRFKDGGSIEYEVSFDQSSCSFKARFMNEEGRQLG